MNEKKQLRVRTAQVLSLVEREDSHLMAVKDRFFGGTNTVDANWLAGTLAVPEGVDRLESFVGKFTRMQDTVMDKLVPLFLRAVGEPTGTAIDNLNRMEKLGFTDNANDWIELRYVRNQLVHEYLEDPEVMVLALNRAKLLTETMHKLYVSVKNKMDELNLSV